ncbi:MAG: protein phosphatase 2C domain-containing protein [Deltaproteobacteria bacterium]
MSTSLRVAGRTDVGRKREQNEDAFAIVDLTDPARPLTGELDVTGRRVLLAVSDGMGGHQAGEVASAIVIATVIKSLTAHAGEPPGQALELAVRDANQAVRAAAIAQDKQGMGATLTAVMIDGEDAWIAEIGDSRAYLLRNGQLRQLTRDQSFVQLLVDVGAITVEEAKTSPRKNVILQAIGTAPTLTAAIGRLLLRRGDRLLVCCDGLSNELADAELSAIMAEPEPVAASEHAIAAANAHGGNDNITAIIAHVGGDGIPETAVGEHITATYRVVQDYGKPGEPPTTS